MLSKKMAVSLTSLIAIFALAFVGAPAMAEFGVSLSVGNTDNSAEADVSYADDVQSPLVALTLRIKTDKVVNIATDQANSMTDLGRDDIELTAYNEFGGTHAATAITADITAATPADGKNFTIVIPAQPAATTRLLVRIAKHKIELADPRAELDGTTRKAAGKSNEASIEIHYVGADPTGDNGGTPAIPNTRPRVHSIVRPGDVLRPVTAATFDVLITLSEEPRKDGFKKDQIDAANAAAGDPTFLRKFTDDDGTTEAGLLETGRDNMLYEYVVTITPKYENKNDIVVKVKSFYDQEKMSMNMYMPPALPNGYTEGMDQLTVKVGREDLKAKAAGIKVGLPKEKYIPGSGYLVVLEDLAGSSVHKSDTDIKDPPKAHQRTPAELQYNTLDVDIPNLETHLANGGTIGVMSPHALVITEIMWGSDAGLAAPGNSQWIELYNAGAGYQTQDGDNTTYLIFYGPGEAPTIGLKDLVGTVDDTAGYWSIAGKGQSGRTQEKAAGQADAQAVTSPLISMNRVMDATGAVAKGTLASSWVASTPPSSNFESNRVGVHIGSPGAMPVTFPEPPAPAPEPTPAPVIPVAGAMDIKITEIMVDTGSGRLPQWIELTNVSGAEKSLAGWSLMISNAAADADVIGATVNINLSGTLGVGGGMDAGGTMGKSLLLVGGTARSSSNLAGSDRVVDISSQVNQRGRYTFISAMGFMAALIPPQKTGVLTYGDTAGNLGADAAWDIPMDEDGRSSLIRREMLADGTATMGTDANGWVLASDTPLVSGPTTWYGSDEDEGSPGYDAGGPLPVELSHFRPARDKATGQVVITWATQSELNNAGFFIKRSNQRDGEFKVINATMIAGAGTTSEKQTYTYTDTTAQPNIVYYYQIEDVSLDGQRQTLTLGTRLKGHVGAAGKATTTWGALKTSHE